MTAPEIQLGGMEELDMTEAELVDYAEEEVTYRGRVDPNAFSGSERPARASAPGSVNSLPAYELEEDPSDGTTALPAEALYPEPYDTDNSATEPLDGHELPAFPLEDSVPALAPSRPPARVSPRSNPVPQISLRSSVPTSPASSKPQAAASASAPQRFSRPVSRTEGAPSARPGSTRQRPSSPGASERAAPVSRKPPSLRTRGELEQSPEPPASSQPPSRVAKATLSSPMPMLSMEDLEGVAYESEYDADEATTSVPPPISSVPPTVTDPMFDETDPPSSPHGARSGAPVPSEAAPASGGRGASVVPSQPPTRIDRETPIPSSASELKPASLRGIVLAEVRGLCDLPEESHRLLRQRARVERMGTGEDLSFFSVVLVLEGWVKLMPAIADVTCATAAAGEVVFTQGTLDDGVALRVVAGQNGTTLAIWDRETFDEITQSCPWVADELRLIADSFQALAGASLGMLGERLDDALREVVTSRCSVLTLLPGEILVHQGKPVPGMHIVGAGLVEEVNSQGSVTATISPGDFLLIPQVLAGGVSPNTVRAGSNGALILFAPRLVAHELLVSVPPLLEILAG